MNLFARLICYAFIAYVVLGIVEGLRKPTFKGKGRKIRAPKGPADCKERDGCVSGKKGEKKTGTAGRYLGACLPGGIRPAYPLCRRWLGFLYVNDPCYYPGYYNGLPYYYCYW